MNESWYFCELSPFESHLAIAVLAVATWAFVIVPLWKFCRGRFSWRDAFQRLARLSSLRNPRTRWLAAAAVLFVVFAFGLWIGWHKELATAAITKCFNRTPGAAASSSPTEAQSEGPSLALAVASVAPALTPPTTISSEIDRLTKQAQAARESGDTVNALARLNDAAQRDPKNAEVLAEMAMIYESTQNFDKSAETWRRVQDMGPSAGPLYDVADMKLRTGVPTSTSTTAAAPAPTVVVKLDVSASRGTAEGIPPGSTLGISEISVAETPNRDAEKSLMLRITVKKRPSAVIDHTKVKIQVFFYDTVGANDVKLTDADAGYEWLTPNHNWEDSNTETLAVTYSRPKSKTKAMESSSSVTAAINPAKKGKPIKAIAPLNIPKYLGYIVRVYYNDQLQDKRADPPKLLNLFPAPYIAPPVAFKSVVVALTPGDQYIDDKASELMNQAGRSWLDQKELQQARQAYQERQFAAALAFIDQAEAAHPNQASIINLRGEILMAQKQFDQAEGEFKKALQINPNFRQAQFNLALVPLKKKDYTLARNRFESLLSKTPGGDKSQAAQIINFDIYMTCLLEGKESRAQKMMKQFSENTPALCYAQAAWEFKHNNPNKAVDLITSAKKIYSPALNLVFADSFYDLGWLQSPAVTR